MSSWDTQEDSKNAELILLIARQTEEDPTAGSTKLSKILYFAEISHMRRTAKEVEEDYFGYAQKRLMTLRSPDLSESSGEEIASVMDMIRRLWGKNAREVSEISPDDPGWRAVEEGESIPLEMAFVAHAEVTERDTRTRSAARTRTCLRRRGSHPLRALRAAGSR